MELTQISIDFMSIQLSLYSFSQFIAILSSNWLISHKMDVKYKEFEIFQKLNGMMLDIDMNKMKTIESSMVFIVEYCNCKIYQNWDDIFCLCMYL